VLERLAYLLKHHFPVFFRSLEALAHQFVRLRFGRRIAAAEVQALTEGTVSGRAAQMRALGTQDLSTLHGFLHALPEDWLTYFRPHDFDRDALSRVLRSKGFLCYGLFVEENLVAYALLKVAPTGSAFRGRLVAPDYAGQGLGKFLARFLNWQASLSGLRPRSTISRKNHASLKSLEAAAGYRVIGELPNDYIMIEFPRVAREKPELILPGRGERSKAKGEKNNG
jgi:GNAT superfamily N-acetyltransferase